MIGISTVRLRDLESESPWWKPELRTAEGYDVCGIVRAQLTYNLGGSDKDLAERKQKAEVEKLEFQRQSEELKAWQLDYEKQQALGNILPADVYEEFSRELLGMVRTRIEQIPGKVKKQASPEQMPLSGDQTGRPRFRKKSTNSSATYKHGYKRLRMRHSRLQKSNCFRMGAKGTP